MTIFAEPSVTLCGARHPTCHAICVREHPHEEQAHEYEDVLAVHQHISSTFTPCKWARPMPWSEDAL